MTGHPSHHFSLSPHLRAIHEAEYPRFSDADTPPLQDDVNGNIRDIYKNLDRV